MPDVPTSISPRGFVHGEEIDTAYGAKVTLAESSAAFHPRIWLWARQPEPEYPGALERELGRVSVHLSIPQAEKIRDNLNFFIEKARAEWGELDAEGEPIWEEDDE